MEKDQDKIFEQYTLLRLLEDHDISGREYLDSSEFHLEQSPSLEFLSEQTGVKLRHTEPKWITDGPEDEDFNYYFDEKERVLVILPEDILQTRRENIKRISENLPEELAQKVKSFEKNTEYLYARQFSSTQEIVDKLGTICDQLENNNTLQRLVISHINRISPLQSKRELNKAQKLTLKAVNKEIGQRVFYRLILDIHNPKNKDKRIPLYEKLFKEIDNRDSEDLRRYMGDDKYDRLFTRIKINYLKQQRDMKKRLPEEVLKKVNATILRLATTELKRDIYEQLYKLHKADMHPKAKLLAQDLEAYNKACSHFKGRLFGPKGAFEEGGIYGPDSPFSCIKTRIKNQDTTHIIKQTPPAPSKKDEQHTQLTIFSDSDFQY